jgi:sigma-B regulation protein RsbU (phosphoserine phosphatase)
LWDSIIKALSGPLLAKLALAAALIELFVFLRRRDTEGSMAGYAFLAGFLALRDLLFAFVADRFLYDVSDLIVVGALLLLGARPFRMAWPFWAAIGIDAAAIVALSLQSFGVFLGPSPDLIRLAGLAPAATFIFIPLLFKAEADSPGQELSLGFWLPVALGSAALVLAGWALGSDSPAFRVLVTPLFYGFLFSIGLKFIDIVQGSLVNAVDYYEESVDSLYDLLLSTGSAMGSETFLQDVVDNMTRTVVERTGADGGALVLADEFEDTVSVRAVHGHYPPPFKLPENLPKTPDRVDSFVRHARFKLGEGILGEVSRTGKHVFVPQAGPDSPLPDNGDEAWLKAGAFIASPLIVRDRIIGAVSVVKSGEGIFTERDFDRCKLLANFGSIAVANSFSFLEAAERSDIEREADIAASVQADLAPKRLPELRGLALGVFSSSARGVCSDYYDVIPTQADRAVIAVGDVAGKGIAASIVLVMVRSILQLITASTKDAATLLQWVNRGLTGKVDLDHYATLCLAAVDSASGTVELANAGHQPALVCRAKDGALETIESKSVPIGVERGTAYASTRIVLAEGDLLALYTDGIVETMNSQGKQFGRKSLGALLRRNRDLTPSQIAERIETDLLGFAGSARPHDDRTVLVMKRAKA